jgi:hypothetical protein
MTAYHSLKKDIEAILTQQQREGNGHTLDRGGMILSSLTYRRDHRCPSAEDLLTIAKDAGLPFYRTLSLVLKGEWERSLCLEQEGQRDKCDPDFPVDLSEACHRSAGNANFNPDTAQLFSLFENNGNGTAQAGYEAPDFDTLVQQMILLGLHLVENSGPEMARFVESETERQALLRDTSPMERDAFWRERCRWAEAQEALDQVLVQIEERRLRNAETKRQYLVLFGQAEVKLQEAIVGWYDLKLQKDLKQADPSLTDEQLADLVRESESRHGRRKELQKLRDEALLAPDLFHEHASGGLMEQDQIRQYRAQAKSLLRKLRFKIHPDHLKLDPAYQRLTEAQKQELEAMLQRAIEISPWELGFPPGFLEHDMRSVRGLEEALARVDAILENAGLETRVDAQIQGRTLAEQIEWLRRTIRSLEGRLHAARAERHALATDPDSQRMENVLACPEQHDAIREAMARETQEYGEKADQLEEEIKALFGYRDTQEAS